MGLWGLGRALAWFDSEMEGACRDVVSSDLSRML